MPHIAAPSCCGEDVAECRRGRTRRAIRASWRSNDRTVRQPPHARHARGSRQLDGPGVRYGMVKPSARVMEGKRLPRSPGFVGRSLASVWPVLTTVVPGGHPPNGSINLLLVNSGTTALSVSTESRRLLGHASFNERGLEALPLSILLWSSVRRLRNPSRGRDSLRNFTR